MSSSTGPPAYQRFFAELKRRSVFRVMAVYGVVGFVLLQVVDLAVPALLLPEWTYRLVALLLLVGFPIAIVLAWAFERTPGGVRLTQPAGDEELARIAAAPAERRWPIGLAALAGSALLAVGTWWVLAGETSAEGVYDSIAVLPFVNLTGDEEAEYLGAGIAEELRNALAGIEGLTVPSMTTATALKDSTIGTIGRVLDVSLVLEGSVRGAGDRLRITAQLIDAADDRHVWSDSYDRPRSDLLDLQEELTARIVEQLAVEIDAEGARQLATPGTEDVTAYDLYLQGRHFWNKRTPPDMRVAVGLFEDAIRADSTYAPAYAAIAEAYAVPVGWGDDPGHALDEAERYAHLALDIDPTLAPAHTALAFTYMMRDLDFFRARESFTRALELDPRYATAHQWFAELLSAMDRHEEAVASARRAEELDPTPIIRWNVARILYFAGRYEDAIAQVGGTEEFDLFDPNADRDFYLLGLSLYALGDFERLAGLLEELPPNVKNPRLSEITKVFRMGDVADSRRIVARMLDSIPTIESAPTEETLSFAALAWVRLEPDSALARLAALAEEPQAVEARIAWFEVLADASFDVLRDDPRYQELNARFGF